MSEDLPTELVRVVTKVVLATIETIRAWVALYPLEVFVDPFNREEVSNLSLGVLRYFPLGVDNNPAGEELLKGLYAIFSVSLIAFKRERRYG